MRGDVERERGADDRCLPVGTPEPTPARAAAAEPGQPAGLTGAGPPGQANEADRDRVSHADSDGLGQPSGGGQQPGARWSEHRDEDFAAFVRRCGTRLTRFAYLLVGDLGQAEDLVQTALVKTWLRGAHVTADTREAYVRRVIVTTSVSWWRSARWRGERPMGVTDPPGPARPADPADPAERADPTDATAVVDERDALLAALRRLPPRQRAAVVLRHYLALTEAETADILRCSVGTVKSQTSRGLATLRTLVPPA
ncbi:SigE family RNA polymerase sigma factor [Frankia sp. CNm7]|uniref:SigE family RNA polymerase sigma factor n=1 Tax=Frankia nepalensis TaxID=1836974 RepID=A0A937RIV8_9ACTN|nr:SigE family RNA polymerase sigma factor [Frankia nepalensis]MBL7495683.1 SigE family RNA polymerase sigma factor [Frankia nepalensis]MBL7510251.1 SigE family RNA polymerase sigma factor [Frankia nepalensis]MBL7518465.1 SigE family RNA polymerase sigma factor [Frankia nepalensis]MBL7631160.1 SigE family RNA polymerase sigma factor [Frankia nepalensis]